MIWQTISPMYTLESFFRNESETRDFYQKLHDSSKRIIVFIGSGANGKTQLAHQIHDMAPTDFFRIYEDKKLDDLYKDIENGFTGKAIYIAQDVPKTPIKHPHDVVYFYKKFVAIGD